VTSCWLVGPVAHFIRSNEYTTPVGKSTAGKTEALRTPCYWILWQAAVCHNEQSQNSAVQLQSHIEASHNHEYEVCSSFRCSFRKLRF